MRSIMTALSDSLLLLSTLSLIPVVTHGHIQCKDSDRNDVDWYHIYKLPKTTEFSWKGDSYYFLSNLDRQFVPSTTETALSNPKNPLAQTLSPIYQKDKNLVILYSDQPPDCTVAFKYGHTKGVVVFDGDTGFWLIHSVPRFPNTKSYLWPSNAFVFGQDALCVTFSKNETEEIAMQLKYMSVYVYYQEGVTTSSPFWNVILAETPPENTRKVTLISYGGQQFIHYAKYDFFGEDLYSEFVATDLKKKLYVQTWRRTPILASDCSSTYPVCNVAWLTLPSGQSFKYTRDHSKYAITEDGNYICLGDINRMTDQLGRGGGTMCSNLPVVAGQYLSMTTQFESCSTDQPNHCP